ncbi:MAG: hypothetical protein ACRCU2_07755 [Planktothrix sp.]
MGWRVGGSWLYYKDLKFNQTAPVGHLPASVLVRGRGWGHASRQVAVSSLASRLVDCNI